MKIMLLIFSLGISILCSGCTSTVSESGRHFDYHKETKILPNKSTKNDLISIYGQPTATKIAGKYEIITYYYGRKSVKHNRAIGDAVLSIATDGLSDLIVDHGVTNDDIKVEYEEIVAYVDLRSGIIKDFYYHDSDLNGQDESESLFLQALDQRRKGTSVDNVIKLLKKSIKLNPNNHRALNTLAWILIDNNIDVKHGVVLAKKAVNIFPDSPFNNGTLGVGYFKEGKLNEAEKYLEIAINLYPIYAPKNRKSLEHDKAMLQLVRNQKSGTGTL